MLSMLSFTMWICCNISPKSLHLIPIHIPIFAKYHSYLIISYLPSITLKKNILIPTCDNEFCSNIEVFYVIIPQWFKSYQKL